MKGREWNGGNEGEEITPETYSPLPLNIPNKSHPLLRLLASFTNCLAKNSIITYSKSCQA